MSSAATLSRRVCLRSLFVAGSSLVLTSRRASAFGEEGAFHPRLLITQGAELAADAKEAAGTWAREVTERTSAPGRSSVLSLRADSSELLHEPFVIWPGTRGEGPLSKAEVANLAVYLRLGGMLIVDDRAPESGAFSKTVEKELARVLPDEAPEVVPAEHVLYKSFYLLPRPVGRVLGPPEIRAITRGKNLSVLFLRHDLLGALARSGENWSYPTSPSDPEQREHAIRFAVNIAMYALCSDYKDDQVHAPFLMRRRQKK